MFTIESLLITFKFIKNGRNKSITGTSFISRNTATDQGHSHTLNPGCTREKLFLILLLFSPNFSSIFPHSVPQIGPWRGKFTHLYWEGHGYATGTDTIGHCQVTGPLDWSQETTLPCCKTLHITFASVHVNKDVKAEQAWRQLWMAMELIS